MRIIGGKFRGRRIAAPPGRNTRPMLDRVREAMFSTLAPWLEGAHVLDLFAGSGSLGLEALSRGATDAILVEEDRATAELLRENISQLQVKAWAKVVTGDALAPASWVSPRPPDIIFFDPPYPLLGASEREQLLATARTLVDEVGAEEAVLVFHAPKRELDERDFEGLAVAVRHYGTNALWYLQCAESEPNEGGAEPAADASEADEARPAEGEAS